MIESKTRCNKCNSEVQEEKELDYEYYCPECFENMYEFETTNVKRIKLSGLKDIAYIVAKKQIEKNGQYFCIQDGEKVEIIK